MSQDDSERARRAKARRRDSSSWPIRVFELDKEPLVDELDARTLVERVRDCESLSRRAFELRAFADEGADFVIVGAHALRSGRADAP